MSERKISDILSQGAFRHLRPPPDVANLEAIIAAWRRQAVDGLAEHITPVRFVGGELRLETDSPVWASRLRHRTQTLLSRLRSEDVLREILSLSIRLRSP